jgi:hypothetical protein
MIKMDYEAGVDKINDMDQDSTPFTPPEGVKLYHYNIKKPFKSFRKIYVRSDKSLGPNEAIEDVNKKLKEKASNLGANTVINVGYEQGILTLFRGIMGIGQAVYVEDLENVEKTHLPDTSIYIGGLLWLYFGLQGYYHHFSLPVGLLMILHGIFTRGGYINKTYFMIFFGILIFNGLILGGYVLKNGIQLYNLEFYWGIGFFAVILIAFVYSYKNRKNNLKLIWRDQWSFK